ncbi:MAG: hypothetical protein ACYDFU_09630 [Nitrospirota bacterium]
MATCPELIITPCRFCGAHVMSFLCYDERGHAVITCPTCGSTLYDKPYDETSEKFIKNQRSYYALAGEIMPEFKEMIHPGDRVLIGDKENGG